MVTQAKKGWGGLGGGLGRRGGVHFLAANSFAAVESYMACSSIAYAEAPFAAPV